jgi:Protein of unknown function (DUF4038)/Putative collagen-binding domain of a collagenase
VASARYEPSPLLQDAPRRRHAQIVRRALIVAAAALGLAAAASGPPLVLGGSSAAPGQAPNASARKVEHRYDFPLKPSNNRRYLVDQRNVPFMIVGDSPQALIGKLSLADAAFYIADRKEAGFNALWVDLLCTTYTGCRADGRTFDGVAPFTIRGDLSTPNPAYFTKADAVIRLAAKAGMVVFLDPIETGGWLGVLRSNGLAKDRAYGRFLGRRYRSFPNIVWVYGNDFQTWRTSSDDALVLAVAKGIQSADRKHIGTIELNYLDSGSLDDPRWRSVIQLDAAYTYYATYARVLREYNRKSHVPVYMAEAGYEFEQNSPSISKGDPPILRHQEYWSMLSGATGQFYGNHYTWQFADGWKDHLNTTGSAQLGYLVRMFAGLRWFRLVPDQAHRIVTAGYGRFSATGNVGSSDYVTTAATPDGTLAVSYLPAGGTVTVDTSRFAGRVRAHWFDPTSGKYTGAPALIMRAGEVQLAAPGTNATGGLDWVLVLTA